jgi:DHA1 family tetracycline resistance protein-like MFS transporter
MSRDRSNHAIYFILITILIDTIGFGMIAPVMPQLISQLTGEGFAAAARYGGALMFLFAAVQFFAAPILGNLSDRFGRRPVLLISLAALGFDYVLIALAPTLIWLFMGRFVSAIAGATFATANAWVADVSEPSDRARHFGLLSAAWGRGFMLGPVIGGVLGEIGSRVPFWAAAGLALLNVIYGFSCCPSPCPKRCEGGSNGGEPIRSVLWSRSGGIRLYSDSSFRSYPFRLRMMRTQRSGDSIQCTSSPGLCRTWAGHSSSSVPRSCS